MTDIENINFCKEKSLPEYVCVNEIKEMNKEIFIENYGIKDYIINTHYNELIVWLIRLTFSNISPNSSSPSTHIFSSILLIYFKVFKK